MILVFFALRTYALWGCKRVVFVVVVLAYVPGFSMNLVCKPIVHVVL